MRVFISISIPYEIKKEILKIQEKLPEGLFVGKKIDFNNLHLTLKFLGEISKEKLNIIENKLSKIEFNKFNLEIADVGIFDNSKSNQYERQIIVWLGLISKECLELQKIIDAKMAEQDLGFEQERRFMGHLTIARVKSVKNKEKFFEVIKKIKVKEFNLKFSVNSFELMESILTKEKPVYKIIEKYNLH